MKYIKICLLILILIPILLLVALLVVPEKVDFSIYQPQIEKYLKSKTGFTVSLGENVEIKLLPQPYIKADNVVVKSFVGDKNIFHANKLEFSTSLQSLLAMNVNIKKLLIETPTIYLHKNIDNQANWQPKRVKRRGGKSVDLSVITGLGDIVISNASVVYEDDLNGSQFRFLEGQFSVGGKHLADTNINFSGVLNAEKISTSLNVDLTNITETNLTGDMVFADNHLSYEGIMNNIFSNPVFKGKINLSGPTVFDSAYKIMAVSPSQRYINFPVLIESKVNLSSELIEFNNLKTMLSISPTTVNFVSDIKYVPSKSSRKSGYVELNVKVDEFINFETLPFCQKPQEKNSDFKWSKELLDLTFVKTLNANIQLNASNGFSCAGKSFDKAYMDIVGSKSVIKLNELSLIKGEGALNAKGQLSVKGAKPKGSIALTGQNFDIAKFMSSSLQKRLTLPLDMNANLNFEGRSSAQWVESLKGEMEISSTEITTVGINSKSLQTVVMSLFGLSGGDDKVDASFTMNGDIKSGVLRTENMKLKFPKMIIDTKGKVDLRRMAMNLRSVPNSDNVLGYDMSVLIKGSVFKPIILPEVSAMQGSGVAIGAILGGPVGAVAGAVVGSMLNGENTTEEINSENVSNENEQEKQKLRDEVLRFLSNE